MTEQERGLLAVMLADNAAQRRRRSMAIPGLQKNGCIGSSQTKNRELNRLILELYKKDLTILEIGRQLQISRGLVAGVIHRYRIKLIKQQTQELTPLPAV
jgi:hypothetical protein